ncbi:MAG: hypothetical protein ACYTKC_16255 [Planctomycetota bacterium]|jgi:hypothetical protein
MKLHTLAVASFFVVLPTPALPAQLQVVVPPGFATKDGGGNTGVMGAYPYTRYQLAEGGLHGRVTILKRVGFRHAHLVHHLFTSYGRTFTNVKLTVAPCDVNKMSRTFSANALLTPRVVHDAKVSWPTQKGVPKVKPAPFNPLLSFPFTSVLVHVGQQDLLLDFTFRGGTLENNGIWPATSTQPYNFDGAFLPGFGSGRTTPVGPVSCKDTGLNIAADSWLSVLAYGDDPRNPTATNKFFASMYTTGAPKGTKVVHGLGVTGSTTGVDIGSCNRLFVNPQILFHGTSTDQTQGIWNNLIGYFPYDAKLVGLKLWAQGAWNDSRTGVLKLTRACHTIVPQKPQVAVSRRHLWHFDPNSATGFLSISGLDRMPVVQYSAK